MPRPRASLSSFLSSAKSLLSNPSKQQNPLHVIIGNESADLDSICSAVVLAYIRTYAPKSSTFYIPISNLPRADLNLRPELQPVLARANLKLSDLITLSDLPSGGVGKEARWILVDHNALQGDLGKEHKDNVVGCIDHHEEENAVPKETGEEPRIVEKAGSCASLVVRYCKETWDELSRGDGTGDEALAALAIAPVLIDTQNLKSEGKTTEADRKAISYLEGKMGGIDREGYLEEIQKAKENIGELDLKDILRKDYKQWNEKESFNIGVSSVVKNISFLIEKSGGEEKFFDDIAEFAKDRKLDISSIMTTSHVGGVFRRELLVWALNEKGAEAGRKFENEAQDKLGLATWENGRLDLNNQKGFRRCWWQERVEHSRKQVAPLLRSAAKA